jgi:hypothetical protein
MTPDIPEELLIDYLYDEVTDEQRAAVEAYLDANPEKREDLAGLSQARGVLAQWEDEEPASQVVFVTDRRRRFSRRSVRIAVGSLLAVAAVLALMFANVEVGVRDGRFHFVAGSRTTVIDTLTSGSDRLLTVGEFATIQSEYFKLTRQLIETSELRQRQSLMRMAADVETKRREDLYYVGQGIQDVGRSAGYGLERTSAILTQLVDRSGSPR